MLLLFFFLVLSRSTTSRAQTDNLRHSCISIQVSIWCFIRLLHGTVRWLLPQVKLVDRRLCIQLLHNTQSFLAVGTVPSVAEKNGKTKQNKTTRKTKWKRNENNIKAKLKPNWNEINTDAPAAEAAAAASAAAPAAASTAAPGFTSVWSWFRHRQQ